MLQGCGTIERLVQQPVPVTVTETEFIPVPDELLLQRSPVEIAGGVGDFSGITYADALVLWARDRQTIKALNAQLQAIGELDE